MNYNRIQTLAQNIALPFIFVCIILLGGALMNYEGKNEDIDIDRVRETVSKYAIQCYASEGSYPPNLEYLEENYGLIIDREKYIYYYDVFGSNVLPVIDIQVNNGYEGVQ